MKTIIAKLRITVTELLKDPKNQEKARLYFEKAKVKVQEILAKRKSK